MTAPAAAGADSTPPALRGVGLDQRLGEVVPAALTFRDEAGKPVQLAEYLGKGPVILTLNYYECPMLCTLQLKGLVSALRTLSLEPERDFTIVTVSINPKETPDLAARKKAAYVKEYHRKGAEAGWHFLTGEEAPIRELAKAVGFRYSFDQASGQYAHAAGIMILTPDGRLSRYFYGVEIAPRDLRLGLVESSAGRIGNLADVVLLYCFHYDPATGRYGVAALTSMRVGGAATVLALGTFVLLMLRRETRRRRRNERETSPRVV